MIQLFINCPCCGKYEPLFALHYDECDKEWLFPVMQASKEEQEDGFDLYFEDIDDTLYPDFAKKKGILACGSCSNTFQKLHTVEDLLEYFDEERRMIFEPWP